MIEPNETVWHPNDDLKSPGATNAHRASADTEQSEAHQERSADPAEEPGVFARGASFLQEHPLATAAALVCAGTAMGVVARGLFVRRASPGEVLGDAVERQLRALLHGVRLVRRVTGTTHSA